MLRLQDKYPESIPVLLFTGHKYLISGSNKHALSEYLKIYKQIPNDPFINLFVGVVQLNLVMNRTIANRHYRTMEAFAHLFRYQELRGKEHVEASYNLGRAFHQIGLYHLAIPYYEKVLQSWYLAPTKSRPGIVRDAAHNLSLIFQQSESWDLVRQIRRTYLSF